MCESNPVTHAQAMLTIQDANHSATRNTTHTILRVYKRVKAILYFKLLLHVVTIQHMHKNKRLLSQCSGDMETQGFGDHGPHTTSEMGPGGPHLICGPRRSQST